MLFDKHKSLMHRLGQILEHNFLLLNDRMKLAYISTCRFIKLKSSNQVLPKNNENFELEQQKTKIKVGFSISSNLQLCRNYASVDDNWLKYLKTFLELPAAELALPSIYYADYLNTAKQLHVFRVYTFVDDNCTSVSMYLARSILLNNF